MTEASRGPPRKLTAIGTVGEVGQLFTVYERNWFCKDCKQENYPTRNRCFRCKKRRPEGEHDYVEDAALQAAKAGITVSWQEVIDPETKQIYYYNKESGETQWERPLEMGAAPMATGWFGRGQAGSTAAQQYAERNVRLLSRPARKQKDFIDPKKYHTEGSNDYNIWYDKYSGDSRDNSALKEPAADRCSVEKDGGFTRADKSGSLRKDRRFFCLHFARGMCAKGAECIFFHRTPLPEDDARCDELFDCFGRQKHSTHRDDMNGVGSFMTPSRTLFVGNLNRQKYSPKELEDTLWKHFAEWGEVENLSVIHRLSIAFPRYRLRTSAEFAKESMTCQTLDHKEVLSIRWAKDDPNPVAQEAIAKADKDALAALLQARGVSIEPAAFEYPTDYEIPASKRLKLEDGTEVTAQYPDLAYPNTDMQFRPTTADASSTDGTAAAGDGAGDGAGIDTGTGGAIGGSSASAGAIAASSNHAASSNGAAGLSGTTMNTPQGSSSGNATTTSAAATSTSADLVALAAAAAANAATAAASAAIAAGKQMPKEQYEAYYASCYAHYYAHYHATAALQQKQQQQQQQYQQQQVNTNISASTSVVSQKASLLSAFVGLEDSFVGLDDVSLIQPSSSTAPTSAVAVGDVSDGDESRKRKAQFDIEGGSDIPVYGAGRSGEKEVEKEEEKEVDELLLLLEESDKEDINELKVKSADVKGGNGAAATVRMEKIVAKGEVEEVEDEVEEDVWTEHVDAETGATYYYNAATGESSWGAAPSSLPSEEEGEERKDENNQINSSSSSSSSQLAAISATSS